MLAESPASVNRLSFSDLSFSRLFQDYVAYNSEIAPFFNGDFRSASSFQEATQRALNTPRDRDTLANVLLDQNTTWGLQEHTKENIEKLRDPESVVVITGQQLGLFMSPMYIPYKTLTTLLLAKKLEKELGRPVVPVFWLAGEDHDFEEVASFKLPNKPKPTRFVYAPEKNGAGPVGRMPLTADITQILDGVEKMLPASVNKKDVLAFLRDVYKPGTTFRDAFAKMIGRLFEDTGLVIASVDDPRLKKLCIPLFQKEVADFPAVTSAMEATSKVLEEKYHAQVQINPTNLFMMNDTARYPIDAVENAFHPRGSDQTFDAVSLSNLIGDKPELFSPNVILRPIVQDVLFPTISYIAGPGEIAYYAQCKPAYAWANIPMPVIFPRASISLIEPAIQKAMDAFELPLTAFKEDAPKLFRKYAIEHLELDLDKLFTSSTDHVEKAIQQLSEAVTSWEASLQKTAGSTRQTLLKDLDRFKEQIIKAQKRKLSHASRRIETIHAHLFPEGKLQERSISPLYFLNQYGLDFFKSLMKDISIDTTSHQVIKL